ncbi:MAG: Shedu anti-phage system protein SduA domain-containing protein [Thermomicrobiales bacterium]
MSTSECRPTATKITPKVRLGSQHVTDFVIELVNEEYIVVEIEAARHKLFKQDGDLTAAANHAVRQATDWRQWVIEHGSYARTTIPQLSNAYDPDAYAILGRRPESSEERTRLRRTNRDRPAIQIKTYDDLLNQAEQYLENLRIHLAPRAKL